MPPRGARRGVDMRRAAAVLLLVAVAAVGLRAGGAFSSAGTRDLLGLTGRALYWALAIVELILAVAGLILLVARFYWARKGKIKLERRRRSIWWVLLLPVVVFFLSEGLAYVRKHAPALQQHARRAGAGGHAAARHAPGSPWPVLVMLAVAALAASALIAYRRRSPAASVLPGPAGDTGTEPLAEALAAGAQALESDPDPRAAIIGCYAAMERSLADAGSPALAADTPAEVLARATEGGLVGSTSAETLTGLFRRARYSGHPVTEADRAAAMQALGQVRDDLAAAERAAAERAGTERAGTERAGTERAGAERAGAERAGAGTAAGPAGTGLAGDQ